MVAAIDSKRVELAKLQDRFRHRVDLAPSDIREVATKRVLAKKDGRPIPVLKKLFAENQGQLNAALRLERTTRRTEITEADFVQFYPYPPHYIDLCIGIMSGIRLQPGAPRHYGGSNRTIIKQAYEMLVSERTALARKPVGTLVTLDKVYELVEGNLSNEKRTDIHEIGRAVQGRPETTRAGRCGSPRSSASWSSSVTCPAPRPTSPPSWSIEVGQARPDGPRSRRRSSGSHDAQFVRNTEEGWKLQTRPGEELGDGAAGLPRAQAPGAERDHPHRPAGDLRRAGAQDLPPQGTPQLPHRRGGRGRDRSKTATCR